MQRLSFKPWHGQPYQRFNIIVQLPERKRRIGRMLAPNHELALIKARELFPSLNLLIEKRPDKPKKKKKQKK